MQIPVGSFKSGALFIDIKDHFPLFCVLQRLKTEYSTQYVLKRNLTQKIYDKFKRLNWTYLHQEVNFDQPFSYSMIHFARYSMLVFWKERTQKIEYKTRYQWMFAFLSKCIDRKNKLFILSKFKPILENFTAFKYILIY